MPGVATAPESHVAASAKVMNYLIHDCLKEEKEVLLTFECSNRSARYIPKIVKRLFDQANFFEADELIEQKHRYEVVNLN
jgi:hypothetical protein